MAPKLSTTLFLILTLTSSTLAIATTSKPSASASAIEFVRTSCLSTLYPSLCFTNLSPYASSINHNPLKLSQVATSLSLSRLRSVSSHVSAASVSIGPSSISSPKSTVSIANALKDCVQVLGNAADRTKDSMNELNKLKKSGSEDKQWCLSNVKTWMSAVLTSEETCTDGLKEAGAAAKPSSDVGVAKEYTSIALALVNNLS